MIRRQMQLSEEQLEALKRLAAKQNLSVAMLVRNAIASLLKSERIDSAEDRRRRAMEAAGRFASGRKDVSRKHDAYLTEAYRS